MSRAIRIFTGTLLLTAGCAGTSMSSSSAGTSSTGTSSTGTSAPPATCHEGLTDEACEQLRGILLPAELPPARGNAHADEFNASLLGFHFFFDSRFSKGQTVRCESCHSVDHGFADGEATPSMGLGPGVRNAPTLFNAARYSTFLWDGRADTLWSQPLFALENPNEMGTTRLDIVHLIGDLYGSEYEDAFGPLPDFSSLDRFPASGAPGDAAYDAMTADDKATVNGVVANIGKALEAYMRNIATGPSPIDTFLAAQFGAAHAGAPAALDADQDRGMVVFATSGCLDCHKGPALSDNQFHNLGVPAAAGQSPDPGRSDAAIAILEDNPFNASGPFFDGPRDVVETAPAVLGGFRTPSLRNLASSGPYGHNGSFATLDDVIDFHLAGGGRDGAGYVGTVDPLLKPRELSSADRAALKAFLLALQGSYPGLPWGQWPGGNG